MIELLLGKAGAIGAGIVAVLGVLAVMFRTAFKAGKDSQLAKEGKAHEKALDDIARANRARSDAERLPDDKYKRD